MIAAEKPAESAMVPLEAAFCAADSRAHDRARLRMVDCGRLGHRPIPLKRGTRNHADTDVLVLRADQVQVCSHSPTDSASISCTVGSVESNLAEREGYFVARNCALI
jgi:hypothetical protein